MAYVHKSNLKISTSSNVVSEPTRPEKLLLFQKQRNTGGIIFDDKSGNNIILTHSRLNMGNLHILFPKECCLW